MSVWVWLTVGETVWFHHFPLIHSAVQCPLWPHFDPSVLQFFHFLVQMCCQSSLTCLPLLSFGFQCMTTYQFTVLTVSFSCLLQAFETFDKLFCFSLIQLVLLLLLFLGIFQLNFCSLQFCYHFFKFLLLCSTDLYNLASFTTKASQSLCNSFVTCLTLSSRSTYLPASVSLALKLLLSAYSLLTSHCRLSTCVHRASITLSIMQTKTLIFLHETLMSPLRVPFEFHGTMDSVLLFTIVSWLALFSVLFLYLSKDTEQKACLCDVKLCLPRCHRFSTSGYNNLLQLTPQSCCYIC